MKKNHLFDTIIFLKLYKDSCVDLEVKRRTASAVDELLDYVNLLEFIMYEIRRF